MGYDLGPPVVFESHLFAASGLSVDVPLDATFLAAWKPKDGKLLFFHATRSNTTFQMHSFAQKIEMLADFCGGVQVLADRLGVHRETIRKWRIERPKDRIIVGIAQSLGLSAEELLDDEMELRTSFGSLKLHPKVGNLSNSSIHQSREIQLEREKLELERKVMHLERELKSAEVLNEGAKGHTEALEIIARFMHARGVHNTEFFDGTIAANRGISRDAFDSLLTVQNWLADADAPPAKPDGFPPKVIEGAGKPLAPMPGFETRPDPKKAPKNKPQSGGHHNDQSGDGFKFNQQS